MLAEQEAHHVYPRVLLKLWDEANGSLPDAEISEAWLSWEDECARWSVPVEISRRELAELVKRSEVVLERKAHRLLHASDWQRWGRRGGLTTLRKYGSDWFALLALKRWGRISADELDAARPLR